MIAKLLEEKNLIKSRLEKMIFGSIEIRERNEKKYIYVHYREKGRQVCKYVGEYTIDLYNVILENNNFARSYKKRLREIEKQLAKEKFYEYYLSEEVSLNIDFARKNLADSIYKQAMLEGVATTYSDTETLINGGKVNNMTGEDVQKVINLKHAWEFILLEGVIEYPSNFEIVAQINAIVEEGLSYTAGKIRSIPVSIGGSTYIPPLPFEDQVKEDIRQIVQSSKPVLDRAIEILLYVMKKQLFIDGNKRTAVIFANHVLIKEAGGLIVVPAEKVDEYKKLLIHYYETDQKEEIVKFLKRECYRALK